MLGRGVIRVYVSTNAVDCCRRRQSGPDVGVSPDPERVAYRCCRNVFPIGRPVSQKGRFGVASEFGN